MGYLALSAGGYLALSVQSLDADAEAFLTAAGISDGTITTAIDDLVIALKAASIWTKFHAVYPFVGGSALTHKWNLIDPRDDDAAFRLTFHGTWTHDANGITPDGSTAYADTKFNCATHYASTANASLGMYSRTEVGTGGLPYDMGAGSAVDTQATICIARYNNNRAYFTHGTSNYSCNAASTDGRGLWTASRTDGTNSVGYKNDTQIVSAADTVSFASVTLYLGANHRGASASYFSPKNQALAFIGDGLSGAEVADLYTAVQAFQTALGRAV